jgi:hypothetical protein
MSWYTHPVAVQAGSSFAKTFAETVLINFALDKLHGQRRMALQRLLVPAMSVAIEWGFLSRFRFNDWQSLLIAAAPRFFDVALPATLRTVAKPLGYLGYAKTIGLFFDKRPVWALLSFASGVGGALAGRTTAELLTTVVLGKERSQGVRETWYDTLDYFVEEEGVDSTAQPVLPTVVPQEQAIPTASAWAHTKQVAYGGWQLAGHVDSRVSRTLSNWLGANVLFQRLLSESQSADFTTVVE